MRRFLSVLALSFLSVQAFAMGAWAFEGKGTWMAESGEKGRYDVMITAMDSEGSMTVTEKYVAGDERFVFDFEIVKKGNGFADIVKDGEKIGSGYCWRVSTRGKVCHHSYTYMGKTVEKTCHLHGDHIKRVGSITMDDHPVIKFRDKLEKDD